MFNGSGRLYYFVVSADVLGTLRGCGTTVYLSVYLSEGSLTSMPVRPSTHSNSFRLDLVDPPGMC